MAKRTLYRDSRRPGYRWRLNRWRLFGQKLTDREQNRKIKKLTEQVEQQNQIIAGIRNELDQNTLFDKQLREELKEHREGLNSRLDRMEAKQDKVYDMIFAIVNK